MTNKNLTSINRPFLLHPAGKDYLWGGNRLNTDFGKNIDMDPLAETWECSTHPDGQSIIADGEFTGLPLGEVLEQHPEYLGTHPLSILQTPGLPILIKLIDACKDLSVQVHPNDTYARTHEHGSLGKTEMWYVLDAAPDAKLIYGFNRDMTPDLLRHSLEQGNVEKYLQKIPVQKDDVFYIEAGTVHAIGAGSLIAEIQENSNLTYRLYDYNRTDPSGKPRTLHIDKAMDVLNYQSSDQPRQPIRVLRYHPGCASELLCRCKYFQVERLLINTQLGNSVLPDCSTADNSFQVLLCVDGEGFLCEMGTPTKTAETDTSVGSDIAAESDTPAKTRAAAEPDLSAETAAPAQNIQKQLPFSKGSCLFLPANSVPLKLQGKAQLLRVSC